LQVADIPGKAWNYAHWGEIPSRNGERGVEGFRRHRDRPGKTSPAFWWHQAEGMARALLSAYTLEERIDLLEKSLPDEAEDCKTQGAIDLMTAAAPNPIWCADCNDL
jgi:hypothetical protein